MMNLEYHAKIYEFYIEKQGQFDIQKMDDWNMNKCWFAQFFHTFSCSSGRTVAWEWQITGKKLFLAS